jgi:hypothetical protein
MRLYGVPLIRQEKSMSCWHAAARMLYGYKRLACIDPLPNKYATNAGINAREFIRLAQSVGLKTLPRVNMSFDWRFIDDLLRYRGPIWAAGRWNGFPHIVVITGVDQDGTLYVNDPALGLQKRNMGWFNERISTDVPIPMMYLP